MTRLLVELIVRLLIVWVAALLVVGVALKTLRPLSSDVADLVLGIAYIAAVSATVFFIRPPPGNDGFVGW